MIASEGASACKRERGLPRLSGTGSSACALMITSVGLRPAAAARSRVA
jgi:hypothetical protein